MAARRQRLKANYFNEFLFNCFDARFAELNILIGGVKNGSYSELLIFLSVQPLHQRESSTFVAGISQRQIMQQILPS